MAGISSARSHAAGPTVEPGPREPAGWDRAPSGAARPWQNAGARLGCRMTMIVRIWRGATLAERADDYVAYLRRTGVADYAATPGNRGVEILTRAREDRTEFTVLSWWDDLDAVRRFAGDDPEVARFYPEDDDYLVERDLTVSHHEVALGRRVADD